MLLKKKINFFSKKKKIKKFIKPFRLLQSWFWKTNEISSFLLFFYKPVTFLEPKLSIIKSFEGVSTQISYEYLSNYNYLPYNIRLKRLYFNRNYSNKLASLNDLQGKISKEINSLFL